MVMLIVVRHAESSWNAGGRLAGWEDPALSERGRAEAVRAGVIIGNLGAAPTVCFTSELQRARSTALLLLEAAGRPTVPARTDWRLNERNLGQLQGMTKIEISGRYGNRQRKIWRDDPDAAPPPFPLDHPANPSNDGKYAHVRREELPNGETRRDTHRRVISFWHETAWPRLRSGDAVLLVTHAEPVQALRTLQLAGSQGTWEHQGRTQKRESVANAEIFLYREPHSGQGTSRGLRRTSPASAESRYRPMAVAD